MTLLAVATVYIDLKQDTAGVSEPAWEANLQESIPRAIVGYHLDEHLDWVGELACGHGQHLRHDPPWVMREWVTTIEGRQAHLGAMLGCRECARKAKVEQSGSQTGD